MPQSHLPSWRAPSERARENFPNHQSRTATGLRRDDATNAAKYVRGGAQLIRSQEYADRRRAGAEDRTTTCLAGRLDTRGLVELEDLSGLDSFRGAG